MDSVHNCDSQTWLQSLTETPEVAIRKQVTNTNASEDYSLNSVRIAILNEAAGLHALPCSPCPVKMHEGNKDCLWSLMFQRRGEISSTAT
jgi:hypothetical protein